MYCLHLHLGSCCLDLSSLFLSCLFLSWLVWFALLSSLVFSSFLHFFICACLMSCVIVYVYCCVLFCCVVWCVVLWCSVCVWWMSASGEYLFSWWPVLGFTSPPTMGFIKSISNNPLSCVFIKSMVRALSSVLGAGAKHCGSTVYRQRT